MAYTEDRILACSDNGERVVRMFGNEGVVVVREEVRGSSALIGYGEEEHLLVLSLTPTSAKQAGFDDEGNALAKFFSSKEVCLGELMDALDAWGIPYTFSSMGPLSGTVFRPAREEAIA